MEGRKAGEDGWHICLVGGPLGSGRCLIALLAPSRTHAHHKLPHTARRTHLRPPHFPYALSRRPNPLCSTNFLGLAGMRHVASALTRLTALQTLELGYANRLSHSRLACGGGGGGFVASDRNELPCFHPLLLFRERGGGGLHLHNVHMTPTAKGTAIRVRQGTGRECKQ